jgi:hypothetical protein
MGSVGYAWLIDNLKLPVRAPERTATIASSVNRRVDVPDRILFPVGVALDDTPLGHLEFALRHEGVNLEVIDAAFEHIAPGSLIERLRAAPNGEYIRRACFLWEWLSDGSLNAGVTPTGNYVDLFPADDYVVAAKPVRNTSYRVNDNALGNPRFCPVVRRSAIPADTDLAPLMEEARLRIFEASTSADLYDRAVRYLYLSETRGSFAIENETPSAQKEERFVQLLRRTGERATVTEDWLADLQNTVVKDAFSHEASYRVRQNRLEDSTGRITFFPPAPDALRELMAGWEVFVNDTKRGVDPLIKAACASFGFVYLHPFMDGNGRLHRFMIHQVLAQAGVVPENIIIPVSAVIMKNIPDYLNVLRSFSVPTTRLWDYRRGDPDPLIIQQPGSRPYRFFDASREVSFLHAMIKSAILHEIPQEVAYLRGYDEAFSRIDAKYNLPKNDISALIRMVKSNGGKLSGNRRKQYAHLPTDVLDDVEVVINEAFATGLPIEQQQKPAENSPPDAGRESTQP